VLDLCNGGEIILHRRKSTRGDFAACARTHLPMICSCGASTPTPRIN